MARNFCSVNYGKVINSMTTFGLLLQQDVTCLSSRLDKIQTEKKHKKNFLLLFDQIKVQRKVATFSWILQIFIEM